MLLLLMNWPTNEVETEAFTLVMNLWLLNLIPYDELGKALLCQTEGFPCKQHMLESCTSSDVMCKISTCCLKLCSDSVVHSYCCLLMVMACFWLAFSS
jgi:hypothetical protein